MDRSRSTLRRIYREEKKRNPALTWAEYLHRLDVIRRTRQAITGDHDG